MGGWLRCRSRAAALPACRAAACLLWTAADSCAPAAAAPAACECLPVFQGWCTLTDVDRFKTLMERLGLYRRLPMPQALLRSHERQVQERLRRSQAEEQQHR